MATSNDELLAAVIADPDDRELALVYADTLIEAGDPHGELIALQAHGDSGDRELELRQTFEREIVGAEYDDEWTVDELVIEWRWGFIRTLHADVEATGLDHRAARLIADLSLSYFEGPVDSLLTATLPVLTRLKLDMLGDPSAESMNRLYERFPRIEELLLATLDDAPSLGRIESLANLRTLEVEVDELGGRASPLWRMSLPKLRRLVINTYDTEVDDFAPLLDGQVHDAVTELGIIGPELDDLVPRLLGSDVLGRLTALCLDVDEIEWNEDAEELFRDNRDAFADIEFFSPMGDDDHYEWQSRARLYTRCLGRHEQALELLARVEAAEEEEDGDTYIERAHAYLGLENHEEAARWIERARASDICDPEELEALEERIRPQTTARRLLAGVRRLLRR